MDLIDRLLARCFRWYSAVEGLPWNKKVNWLRHRYFGRRKKAGFRPQRVAVYVTPRCNLSCRMCGYHAEESDGTYRAGSYGEMSLDRFKHIMALFPEALSVGITSEGEPFLNRDVYKMIEYAKGELGLSVDSSTNGIAMDCDAILASGLDRLNVSVDGISGERYVAVRGAAESSWRKVINNLERLCRMRTERNSSLYITASFTISMQNYHEMPKMAELGERLGVNAVHFQNTMDFGTQYSKANRPIFEMDREAVSFIGSLVKPAGLEMMIMPTIFRLFNSERVSERPCVYPFAAIGINTEGSVNPCCYVNTDDKWGNVFTETDCWNNESYQRIREQFLEGQLPFKLCQTCGMYGIKGIKK